ncbi:MAG: hypothetical protein EOO40_08170, partial [Deltaproteobacteria bacterium]
MRTLLATNRMYQSFVGEADLYAATQGAARVFSEATEELDGESLLKRTHKLCDAAKFEPHPRFGDFVRQIATHAALPQPVGAREGIVRPLTPTVLKRERMDEQLMRRLDIHGKAVGQVCADLMEPGCYLYSASGAYSTPVVARVRQRLIAETMADAHKGQKKLFDDLQRRGVSNEALDKAVVW